MQPYRHRQVGRLLLLALGLGVVITARHFILAPEGRFATGPALVIFLGCIFLFYALSVEVNTDEVVVKFGPGLIRKRFRIEEIREAREVRNPWYYGWGIRLTPHGWLFNISGFNAVELELNNNRKFRIGTDDPQGLITAIQTVRQFSIRGD